jgi:hypothetical protein
MTIFELALDHMRECGMPEDDAITALEQFGAGEGRDIEWGGIAPHLSPSQLKRIDAAAVGWIHAHTLCVAEAINHASALEFAVRFEALSHGAGGDDNFPPRAA